MVVYKIHKTFEIKDLQKDRLVTLMFKLVPGFFQNLKKIIEKELEGLQFFFTFLTLKNNQLISV